MKTWKKTLIGALLSLLGFSSCEPMTPAPEYGVPVPDPDDIHDFPAEYGVPSASFRFVGEAWDDEGNLVPGIRIVVAPKGLDNTHFPSDTLYTGADGKVEGALRDDWPGYDNCQVKFEDVDGEENGGPFAEQILSRDEVSIEQTGKGNGHWYDGEFTITAKAILKKQGE